MQAGFIKNVVKGFLVAALTSVVLLFVFGWICGTQEDPEGLIGILGRAALYVSALAGGFAAARFNREKGLICGLSAGGGLMLTVMLISLFLRGDSPMGMLVWTMFLFIPLVAAVGGYIGIPQKKKRKKRNKKRK